MEITAEIKAKVFAHYLGQKVFWQETEGELTAYNLHGASTILEPSKLILKPLSKITHENAVELYKAIKYNLRSTTFILQTLKALPFNKSTIAYQYLISKGYDLPHYLLGGKTLQECGLAIYDK